MYRSGHEYLLALYEALKEEDKPYRGIFKDAEEILIQMNVEGLSNQVLSHWSHQPLKVRYNNKPFDDSLRAAEKTFPIDKLPEYVQSFKASRVSPVAGVIAKGVERDSPPTLPDPEYHPETDPIPMQGTKFLVLSDVHVPHHDKAAIIAALSYGKKVGCDTVVLNGDIADFYAVSYFSKDANKWDLNNEIDMCREFLKYVRAYFPGLIYYKIGNHEERLEKYIAGNARELQNIPGLSIAGLLGLKELGGFVIADRMQHFLAGSLPILHGHEMYKLGSTVSPARGLFLRTLEPALIGHLHRQSEYSVKTFSGRKITTYSTGCLCEMAPRYAPNNQWTQGFAVVTVDGLDYDVELKEIRDGKVV